MKLPCALVRDLLPLYHDQVCAPESCDAVEEHLKDCEACQGVYHALGDAPGEGAPACSLEAAALRQVKKRIQLRYVFITVCVLLLCVGGGAGLGMWMNTATVDIPVENIESVEFTKYVVDDPITPVYGNVAIKVKTDYQDSELNMKVKAMDAKGHKSIMVVTQRVTVWGFVKTKLGIGSKPQGNFGLYTIPLSWNSWQQRLVNEYGNRGPVEEEYGCFISTIYYLPDNELFNDLAASKSFESIRQDLSEEATILWERPEDLFDQE